MRTLTYASRDGADLLLDLYLPASPIRRPSAGDRVPPRGRVVRRNADHRSRLQALLRAGRVRDGVDRVPPHAVDHVSRQRRGRPHCCSMAEGERRCARAGSRTASACGAPPPADIWPLLRRSRRAACSRAATMRIGRARCAACWTPTGRRASIAWMHRRRRSARRCRRRSSPSACRAAHAGRAGSRRAAGGGRAGRRPRRRTRRSAARRPGVT